MRLQSLNSPRFQGTILAIALALFLFPILRGWWMNYWILKDGQTGTALITGPYWGGHGNVNYRYVVNAKEYIGHSARNWRDPRYARVEGGEHCPVYFSASHPWVSALYRPDGVVGALPVVILILLLEACALATVINPSNRYALRLGSPQGSP